MNLDEFLSARVAQPGTPIPLDTPVDVADLPTPALLVDEALLNANLQRMQNFLAERGKGLRPHAKMHKCPVIAHRQMELGAVGICTAKIAEAEAMRAAGLQRILVTSPISHPAAITRAAQLAARTEDFRIVVDHAEGADQLGAAARAAGTEIRVLVDLDPGLGRTGIEQGEPALELVRRIAGIDGLQFTGLQQYSGHLMHLADADERRTRSLDNLHVGMELAARIRSDGHAMEVFTGGGTGTFDIDCEVGGVTDLQCGSYAVMDREYRDIGQGRAQTFEYFEPAMFVAVTAISQPRPGFITVDGGYKAFASDSGVPVCLDHAGIRFHFGGDEHGILQLGDDAPSLAVGNRLRFLTPHCDPTINLYDWIYPVREGQVHELWPITARGCAW